MIQPAERTLGAVCLAASARYGEKTAFSLFREGKVCRQISYAMTALRSRQIGLLLGQLGVGPNDRVLLLSENCPEWPLAYFGIALAGAVSVPLLTGFSPGQVQRIAAHAEVSAIILSREMTAKIGHWALTVPLILIDTVTGEFSVSQDGCEQPLPLPSAGESAQWLPQRKPDDLASIIYTSGTMGNSKGVMLSGANIISSSLSSLPLVKIFRRDRLLSVLPLAHAYECSLGLLAPFMSGAVIAYLDRPPSPSVLLPAAQALRPTVMVTVPLIIEKMYRSAVAPRLCRSRLYRIRLTRALAIRFAGRKLNAALGGKIRIFGTGGAPLSAEVEEFLRRARFPVTPGYGLTEAAPLVSGTAPLRFPFKSSGSAAGGVELRIDGGGEIQVRGPNVMMGYYRDEVQTREAFSADGWLRTGDLGSMDKKGKLYVRGRIKALILGPCGENIYPEEIEGILGTSQLVEEALVYSGAKGELVAMVRLNDAAKAAASAVEHALEELRAWTNKQLANFSRLSRIEIRHEPFEKTPTMKIKRYLYGATAHPAQI